MAFFNNTAGRAFSHPIDLNNSLLIYLTYSMYVFLKVWFLISYKRPHDVTVSI